MPVGKGRRSAAPTAITGALRARSLQGRRGAAIVYSIAPLSDGGESIVTMRTSILLLSAVTFPAQADLAAA